MKSLIIANWKMNPQSVKEAKALFEAVKKGAKNKGVEVIICPPFIYLNLFKGLSLGSQNCFQEEKGAYTGEISPVMLKDMGVEYVIIGHSERRKYFNETNEIINKKIRKAVAAGLKPIFCVGETKEEKEQGKKSEVLTEQIEKGLEKLSREETKKVIIAYEPVWAIGTGDNCSPDETMTSILLIRQIISRIYNRETADSVKILYGGSVNGDNAGGYINETGANGLLVGGASLDAEEFIKIVKSAS